MTQRSGARVRCTTPFAEPHDRAVHLAERLVVPMVLDRIDELRDVDLLELREKELR
jgi:hypothetical protein